MKNLACISGMQIDKDIILSTGIGVMPVDIPVNAITFATGNGNTGTWRVSNNQGKFYQEE